MPSGLKQVSAADSFLGFRAPILSGVLMSLYRECCVSHRSLCHRPISCPEKSYRLWCVIVWSRKLNNEAALARVGLLRQRRKELLISAVEILTYTLRSVKTVKTRTSRCFVLNCIRVMWFLAHSSNATMNGITLLPALDILTRHDALSHQLVDGPPQHQLHLQCWNKQTNKQINSLLRFHRRLVQAALSW